MAKYAIIDVANMFSRARHVTQGDSFTKAGMALSILFKSLNKAHRDLGADHMVFCIEGRSWRYDIYPEYKGKRVLLREMASPQEKEEEEVFKQTLNSFVEYAREHTRATVLQHPRCEGDDFVARWIQVHPNDQHVIISSDSDFVQLLAPNVQIYDGVQERLLSIDGVVDKDGVPQVFNVCPSTGRIKVKGSIKEAQEAFFKEQKLASRNHINNEKERERAFILSERKKNAADPTYAPRPFVAQDFDWKEFDWAPEPEWWRKALFVKLIRGDSSDGIFSAYPKVRYNGSSKKAGIHEAWEDRHKRGYVWNNFMLQTWEKLVRIDADGNKETKMVRVMDEYEINRQLIDLTAQPEEIRNLMDETIVEQVSRPLVPAANVGFQFIKFCKNFDLPSTAKEAQFHTTYLLKGYTR